MLWAVLVILVAIGLLVIFCILSVSAQQDEWAEKWEQELRDELAQQQKHPRAA
jgi:hypothetical protein